MGLVGITTASLHHWCYFWGAHAEWGILKIFYDFMIILPLWTTDVCYLGLMVSTRGCLIEDQSC